VERSNFSGWEPTLDCKIGDWLQGGEVWHEAKVWLVKNKHFLEISKNRSNLPVP
jgi:hypothetical protein